MSISYSQQTSLDNAFNLKPAPPQTKKFVICNDKAFIPHARSSAGGTYKYPWFDAETRRAGGFFVDVGKDKYKADKGRPGMPVTALKHAGMKYRTVKGTMVQGEDISYGYYCKITRCPTHSGFKY